MLVLFYCFCKGKVARGAAVSARWSALGAAGFMSV